MPYHLIIIKWTKYLLRDLVYYMGELMQKVMAITYLSINPENQLVKIIFS